MSKRVFLLLFFVFNIVACSHQIVEKKGLMTMDITGSIITKVESNRILVVSNVPQEIPSLKDKTSKYYVATWLNNLNTEGLKVGQKVKYKTKGLTITSYPGYVDLDYLEVIEIKKPEGANLYIEDVINRAIESNPKVIVFIPMSINYAATENKWIITFIDGAGQDKIEKIIEITDK